MRARRGQQLRCRLMAEAMSCVRCLVERALREGGRCICVCCAKPRHAAHVTLVLVGLSWYHRCVWQNVSCVRLLDTRYKNKYRQLPHNSSHRQRCVSAPFHVMSFWEKSCNESLAKSSDTLIQEASVYGGFVVSRRLAPKQLERRIENQFRLRPLMRSPWHYVHAPS